MKIYINCDDNNVTFNKKNYLLRADRRLDWGIFRDIKGSVETPDYVLNIQPCEPIYGNIWSGLWHIDVSLHSNLPHRFGEFKTALVSSSQGIFHYEKELVLFQACDPELHRRIPEIKQMYDFVICGSLDTGPIYERRREVYNILRDRFTYVDHQKNHRPDEYVSKINQAKVQIVQPGYGSNRKGMLAQRFFECLAIGPVLVDYTDDLLLTGLEEDKDYMCYRNDDELIEKMRYLVDNEDARNKIAESGRKKALLAHTYEHRLISILNLVKEYDLSISPAQR